MSRLPILALMTLAMLTLSAATVRGQQVHRQTFEGSRTQLELEFTNSEVTILAHDLVQGEPLEMVHSGKQAERLVLRTTSGTFCFARYNFGRTLIFEELILSASVYASRPGPRILARVVLPNEIDETTGQPRVLLLPGDRYERPGRWRKLEVKRLDKLLTEQQRLLQAQLSRKVDIRNAFCDSLVLDLHSGLGEVEIRVDDLQISPLVEAPASVEGPTEPVLPQNLRNEKGQPLAAHIPEVRSRADQNRAEIVVEKLLVGERPYFVRGIRRSSGPTAAPLERIKEAQFNTVWVDWPVSAALAQEAEQLDLRLVPVVPLDTRPSEQDTVAARELLDFHPSFLGFDLAGDLDARYEPMTRALAGSIRARDPFRGRPITGHVIDQFGPYSRYLDVITVDRFPLMSSQTLDSYRRWLEQRKYLGRPGKQYWTTIQAHPPVDLARLVVGRTRIETLDRPLGPQPEQLKLLTANALAAGYRGIVLSSDWALSDLSQGRGRMLQSALINSELRLIETFLADGKAPLATMTSHPDVKAVVFRHDRGVLVLAYWNGPQSQYVVGQASRNDLQVVVRDAAESAQAFQITLGEVRALKRRKDLGGIRVTIPEFDTMAMVVLTTDPTIFGRYQEFVDQLAPQAVPMEAELTEVVLAQTEAISGRLERMGKPIKGGSRTLAEARQQLERCRAALQRGDLRVAYLEATRARRLARYVQDQHWKDIVGNLPHPVASPFAVSFFTLPDELEFQARRTSSAFTDVNHLESGDFERDGNLDALGWNYYPVESPDHESTAMLVGDNPAEGRRSLELAISAKNPQAPNLSTARTVVEMVSPPIPVESGQIVRIDGMVRIPVGIQGSEDGAVVWDTLGGRPLALRFTRPGRWEPFTLYRPVMERGLLRLHLAVTGVGAAEFDAIEVHMSPPPGGGPASESPVADSPRIPPR